MTAQRPRLDDASEAYVQRILAGCPPLSEDRKLRLSRLVTPPRRVTGNAAPSHGVGDLGGSDAAA